jgi:hypothetical protein
VTTPEDAIRARRRLTNKLIAGREAQRLRPFFAADVKVIVGDGALILGADEVVAAFAGQMADPAFVPYLREPDRIEIDTAGLRAAESGRWSAGPPLGGTYLAVWRKVTGQWVIESELYVTLTG